jgi:2-polyprenyl-6-methoxyphenol hydroxylase-like FAD-dependent oxidoreductase
MSSMERPLEVVVVGGSIAGLAVAHGLLHALPGCKVTVLERARHLTEGGAGLGLDRDTCTALADWGLGKGLQEASLPLDTEINRAVNEKTKTAREIYRDDNYDHRR